MLLTGFYLLVFFTNLRFGQISGQIWRLSNGSFGCFWSSQEHPVIAGVPPGSILGTTLFLLYLNDLPSDVICSVAIYVDDTTLYSKCDQASDL